MSLYIRYKSILEKKHCPVVDENKKNKIWNLIEEKVALKGVAKRNVRQLKKKIADMKSAAKEWEYQQKNPPTGNSKGKSKQWYFDLILDRVMGEDNPNRVGIPSKKSIVI